MDRNLVRLSIPAAFAALSCSAFGQSAVSSPRTVEMSRIEVTGSAIPAATPNRDDYRAKLDHIMREVDGTEITVTKKATAIKLDQQPTLVNNNQQETFNRAPGVLITEQNTPAQFNISYRGLGNPQESEYVNVLQDGMSIMSDWIGFPTLYYVPLPQSVSEIQVIRGGGSLLYGPEPAPAINYVSHRPAMGQPFSASTEQVGGAYGLYSTFNRVEGAAGAFEYMADFGYVKNEGQRDNSQSELYQADVFLGYQPNKGQLTWFDFRTYHVSAGDPGRVTIQRYNQDPWGTLTPYNHDWVDRYHVTLGHDQEFGENLLLQAKAWFTALTLDFRAAGNTTVAPNGTPRLPATTQFQYEDFYQGGVDVRMRLKYGEGTFLRGSALTFGGVVFHSDAPYQQFISTDLYGPRGTEGTTRLDQDRNSDYQAIFIENIFRFGKFHIVPSFRLDHEEVQVAENVSPFRPRAATATTPARPLADITADRYVPLWGIGLGNDFGHLNETYFSASTGWRPLRYFDVVSPFSPAFVPGQPSDPFESLDIELGVHGTPIKGLWYDVGLFWMEFDNRTESQFLNPGVNQDTILVNSGSTRHRGFEGELYYDLLALCDSPWLKTSHLTLGGNLQLLDAEFTESTVFAGGKSIVGNQPAFAPDIVAKFSLTYRMEKRCNVSLSGVYVSSQYFQDSNLPAMAGALITVPAQVPSYLVFNLTGEFDITKNVKLIAGITNLADERYYSRVFGNGIEPAPQRSGYAGLRVSF